MDHCDTLKIIQEDEKEDHEGIKDEDQSLDKILPNEKKINNLKEQIEKGSEGVGNISSLLEKLKDKQKEVEKEEEKKKPLLTFEMIRKIKLSFNYCKEDRERIENLEESNKTNIQEIMVKLGNKIDSVEVEIEMQKLQEKIEECLKNIRTMNAAKKNSIGRNIPQELVDEKSGDKANRKFIERGLEEVNKKLKIFEENNKLLTKCFSKQSEELNVFSKNLSSVNLPQIDRSIMNLDEKVKTIELKVNSSRGLKVTHSNEKIPLLSYTVSTQKEREDVTKIPNKIIINNNSNKLETEKSLRELSRKIQDLRKEVYQKIDFSQNEFQKFKKSCGTILERQDQSILSILTRATALEIRSD